MSCCHNIPHSHSFSSGQNTGCVLFFQELRGSCGQKHHKAKADSHLFCRRQGYLLQRQGTVCKNSASVVNHIIPFFWEWRRISLTAQLIPAGSRATLYRQFWRPQTVEINIKCSNEMQKSLMSVYRGKRGHPQKRLHSAGFA